MCECKANAMHNMMQRATRCNAMDSMMRCNAILFFTGTLCDTEWDPGHLRAPSSMRLPPLQSSPPLQGINCIPCEIQFRVFGLPPLQPYPRCKGRCIPCGMQPGDSLWGIPMYPSPLCEMCACVCKFFCIWMYKSIFNSV